MDLSLTHLVSTEQLSRKDTDLIMQVSEKMEKVAAKGTSDILKGKVLAALFYEPSTRTRLSFEAAMLRLGGSKISADGLQFSSMYKGETIEDTIKVAAQYADIICMRHPEKGSADKAASVSPVPFINAGDGPGQHPTQALLDLYTIQKEKGHIDDLHVAMVGDLRFGRTVHSLSFLLGLYKNIRFTLISPKELTMPEKVTSFFEKRGIAFDQTENLEEGLDSDVLYVTRVQKERFTDPAEYERLKLKYIVDNAHVKGKNITVMHPLPRVGEIATDVDALPNAAYFRQVKNGVYVRMALLALLLKAV